MWWYYILTSKLSVRESSRVNDVDIRYGLSHVKTDKGDRRGDSGAGDSVLGSSTQPKTQPDPNSECMHTKHSAVVPVRIGTIGTSILVDLEYTAYLCRHPPCLGTRHAARKANVRSARLTHSC